MDFNFEHISNGFNPGPPLLLNPAPSTSTGNKTNSPLVRLPAKPNLTAPRRSAAAKKKTVVENRIAPFAREIVAFQDVIYFFSNIPPQSPLRQQLLYGFDGAPKLEEVHFEMLNKIRELISGHHRANDFLPFPQQETAELQSSSQHFTLLMNGSPIPITGKSFSYAQVKNLIQYIMRSVFYGARQTEQQRIGEQRKAEQQLLSMSNAAPVNLLKPVNGQLFEGMDTNQPFYDRGF